MRAISLLPSSLMFKQTYFPNGPGRRLLGLVLASVLLCFVTVAGQQAANLPDITGRWVPAGGGATFSGGFGFQEDAPERQDGPALVDYSGIPLSDAGRMRALSYDSDLVTVPEHQCMPHPATYSFWGPGDGRGRNAPVIAAQLDKNLDVVAYQVSGMFRRADRTIWMDGRPHPPAYAPHTWAGFTTGRWEGNTLVTDTTHLKWGWIRRNGVITTDEATVRTLYARHGNVLTITVIVSDPWYLTEPYVKTIDFIPAAGNSVAEFGRDPGDLANGVFGFCYPVEEVPRADESIPHYLPWKNPFQSEEQERHHLPAGATLGGSVTALPEFMARSRTARREDDRRARVQPSTPQILVASAPAATLGDRGVTDVHSIRVQGSVWMLVGAGPANIAVQIGDDGVLLVDTGAPGTADAVLAEIRRLTDKPIRIIINTSADPDHVGNNEVLGALAGGATTKNGRGPTPLIVAHSNVLTRMSASGPSSNTYPLPALPSDAYLFSQREFFFNGESIQIIHQPSAHTDGDSVVLFRGSDVLAAGDLFTTTNFALFDSQRGGSFKGILTALNAMLHITVPRQMQEGGTYIIPGHGRISDEADLAESRDQVQMIRDRVADLVQQTMKLDQIKGMRPILDFEGRYSRPDWTADQFLAAVYGELQQR